MGDVNQGFKGLQEKYGEWRVSDTGIREATILGQAIGMALRGLRPLAEIQYLDYMLYALQVMADDLANLLWRTKGGQRAPVIVRTRGHRLEGIWHSGSPMAGLLHLLRGMHVLVPRDMTRAAGFYNTLLLAEEPALVVEVLNGYRIRERLPGCKVEVLIPDFKGSIEALQIVMKARPEILNHNVETVPRLFKSVQPQDHFEWAAATLSNAKKLDPEVLTKSGIMVGLGETIEEVKEVMRHQRSWGVDILTVGQYLQPTKEHLPVDRYVHPDEFRMLKERGLEMGFAHVESGPLVRSSYHAEGQV